MMPSDFLMKRRVLIGCWMAWGLVFGGGAVAAAEAEADWQASWIWHLQPSYQVYNQTILARKEVRLGKVKSARMRVTTV